MPKTILLVEDNDDDVFLITHAFKEAGLMTPLARVAHGQEAIDYLSGKDRFADRAKYPVPALVLLDFKMPFVSGLEVLRWARAQPGLVTLPIVMFTTSNQECDVRNAYAAGVNAYLVKPPRIEECVRIAMLIKQFWIESNLAPLPEIIRVADGELNAAGP